ncbi:MAG: tRNA glutamyl-Q(34) synthetase GluQRS [Actinobacteria bacterium]|uniref:Unannotated protein n=1 Tax=freshwater metagenome TaxID=449393 RepID=A0A6J7E9F4_9ZZZZ|nr:tRNA glutamyl-Q(34) synthetase GluQRS [Actinomycetota bacterium]
MTPPERDPLSLPNPSPQFGRYAPSPSGRLHVGNLRTALVAWLTARSSDRGFLVRIEDLDPDRSHTAVADQQLEDLASIGLDWDTEPIHQSERDNAYSGALARLDAAGLVYPCWCTRAELASAAPHDPQRPYAGKCRGLNDAERAERQARANRPPSLRVSLGDVEVSWNDLLMGSQSGVSSDPVVRRADGVFAYHLAVVVDDAAQNVDQVVRGDDLSDSVPTQAALYDALGLPRPTWGHVPLVVESDGTRLAKRERSVTLARWGDDGTALAKLGASLGLCGPEDSDVTAADLRTNFHLASVPREPWVLDRPF